MKDFAFFLSLSRLSHLRPTRRRGEQNIFHKGRPLVDSPCDPMRSAPARCNFGGGTLSERRPGTATPRLHRPMARHPLLAAGPCVNDSSAALETFTHPDPVPGDRPRNAADHRPGSWTGPAGAPLRACGCWTPQRAGVGPWSAGRVPRARSAAPSATHRHSRRRRRLHRSPLARRLLPGGNTGQQSGSRPSFPGPFPHPSAAAQRVAQSSASLPPGQSTVLVAALYGHEHVVTATGSAKQSLQLRQRRGSQQISIPTVACSTAVLQFPAQRASGYARQIRHCSRARRAAQ